ncbi:glycosyltransferase, YqgM-like family [Citrifermentans bemidjiense Bem]|uniref:Glycosyltransferase, YqgM-like family n=1 Tax=Citrifermentans bemidjiense (strain ATCC BAA-1014 / DSM 16622 / JCM 12645 / Bem) TaxID=404380 RepID=B5EAA2_CITBB|nr:glycosyltransferase [Citrifermentans bemidjiense]ACH38808.1 glycosyltransferase, YqgM-like family [Citrifermentans bemidjiense Bem]
MQNVLFYYSSQQVHTGSPKVLARLIEGLDRTLYVPYFIAGRPGDLSRRLAANGTVILEGEVGQVSATTLLNNTANLFRLTRLLKRNKISLVHINQLGWNLDLAVAARLLSIPVVFHIHNHEQINLRNLDCRLGSRYLFVSRALAEQCDAYRFHPVKTQVLYNPIDIDRFRAGRPIRQELNLPQNAPVVGTVAQICHRKGIDIIVNCAQKVLSSVPEAVFVIAGPDGLGEERFAQELRAEIAGNGLSEKIRLVGPRDDIEDFMASLDLFFLPTRAEPFGMVFVEAMAAGVPVVASNVGGIPEIIPAEEFGILLDSESPRYPEVIAGLLVDADRRRRMAAAAFERARDNFSHSIFNRKIGSLYRELI